MSTKNKWILAAFCASFLFPYFIRTGGGGAIGCGFNFLLSDTHNCYPSIGFLLVTWAFLLVVSLIANGEYSMKFFREWREKSIKSNSINADIELEKARIIANAIITSAEILEKQKTLRF